MNPTAYDWLGVPLVVASIAIVAFLLVPRFTRGDTGNFLLGMLAWGLVARLGFALIRLWVERVVYAGETDAYGYHKVGMLIAQRLWQMEFADVTPFLTWGTRFLNFFTGLVYTVIGPTLLGGYLVYGFLAFLGSYLFYRAFRLFCPQGNARLCAILMFFFPSLLLWSNGIGKDALIFLCIGLFAYGAALLTQGRLRGVLPLAVGFLGTLYIRPHIAAILAAALLLALVLGGAGKKSLRPVTFILGLVTFGALAWLLLPNVATYVGMEGLSGEEAIAMIQRTQGYTSSGGSAFRGVDITSPAAFPVAMVTLLFRPWPWESHNIQALLQSADGLAFAGILAWRLKAVGKALIASPSSAYIRFILIYLVGFALAFIAVENFGILARQRTMILPFVFMLMAYAPSDTRSDGNAHKGAAI
ncbi:MAG: hypothetical protein HYX90_02065 [Chloroflexi bacterium]|nr:hypothetical protein [Chloroflexota bacterium]